MAKDPCKYQLPGSDKWMSELEFKQALSEGLLDQFIMESGLSVPSLKGFSADQTKADSYKLGRGKGGKMTEDQELNASQAISEKERFNQQLTSDELNALRTSIRNKFPDSYAIEVLDQVSEAIKTGESNLPYELDYLSDGVTLNDVANIMSMDDVFESAKEAKNFLRDRAISGDLLNAKREATEEGKKSRSYEALSSKILDIARKSPAKITPEGKIQGGMINLMSNVQKADAKPNILTPSTIPFLPKTISLKHLTRSADDLELILKNGFDIDRVSIDSPIPGAYFSSEDWSTMDRFGRDTENALFVDIDNKDLLYFDSPSDFGKFLRDNNLPDSGVTLSKSQIEFLKSLGIKGILLREDYASQSRNELIVIDDSIIKDISKESKEITQLPSSFSDPKLISKAYIKAKADGSNPELVKIVDDFISSLDELDDESKSVKDKAQSIADKIRSGKMDTKGMAMSSIPGLVEAWNISLEAAAKAVEAAGATADAIQKGIAAAQAAFKKTDFYKSLKDRAEKKRYMDDLMRGIETSLKEEKLTGKQKKAGREFKGKVEEVTGVKPSQRMVTMTEANALKARIKAEVAAAKDAAKAINELKQEVIDFAKDTLPKESYTKKEIDRVLNAVKRSKNEASLNKAIDNLSALVEKKNEQTRKRKISDIRSKIKNKKTLYTKVNGKWRGKVTVDAQNEFNEFIGQLADLEGMSMEELLEVEEIINGIVDNGRADFKRLKDITDDRKARDAADMLEELAGKPDAILSDNDAISEFFEGYSVGYVIIDGKMYNKSSYKSSPYNNKANPEEIDGPVKAYKKVNLSEKKKILEDKKTALGRTKELIKKASIMDNMYGMLQKIGKGKSKTTKFINENIVTPIQDYFIDSEVSFKERMDSYRAGIKDIFGSEKEAAKRLNENSPINPLVKSRAAGVGVSNSRLVSLYNMSRLEDGMKRLKDSDVDAQDLVDYIESQEDLLDYANFLVDQYNEMKAEYEPTYISVTGMPFPEGYYYPAYTDVNFDDDVISESDIIDPEGNFSALSAMTNNLKQRTNYQGAFNTALGAEEIFIDYVKNMERAKYLIPVAKAANQLFAQQNRPYLIDNLTPQELNDLQKQLSIIFTGKRPRKDWGEDIINKFMNFNTVATLGLKLKSIPTQFSSFTNFWGQGIEDGINPLKVITAFPTNANEREFLAEIAGSEYLKERREGKSLDLEVKRILNIKNKTAFEKALANFASKAMFFPGMADYLVNISPVGGGGSYAIAQLRNELAKGLPLDQAKKVAFRNYVKAVEETQQTSREDYIAGFQRSTIGRMFSTYKSSQIGFARKIVKGYRTLGDPKASDAQKAQAYYDMIYYTIFSSILFSLVSNAGWRVLSTPDDEEFNEDLRVGYDVTMDQTQSVAQGFGVTGFLIDALINAARQDEWKMNVPLVDFLLDFGRTGGAIIESITKDDLTDPKMSEEERMRFFEEMGIPSEYYNNEDVEKVIQLYKEASIWQKMTPQQRKKFLKTAGVKNVVEQAKDFYEWSKGEQDFIDAFMNYEKDYFESAKARQKTDFIFKLFLGEDYIPKKRPESAEPEYVGEEMKENVEKGIEAEEINN